MKVFIHVVADGFRMPFCVDVSQIIARCMDRIFDPYGLTNGPISGPLLLL